ncbi:hypothetical protein I4F81_009290 [Pyropia yezoensis]|uniref:Uncharacterized protein n=1 Tax=Pyropia yezoensis TaxID=2788 RepID=A0ACC3C967_PYRYE|nr:hypothetical protein I4F81_009290 [Neopyropia yezoensis]
MSDEALLTDQQRALLNTCLRNIGELISGVGSAITAYATSSETLYRRAGNGVTTASLAATEQGIPPNLVIEPVTVTPMAQTRPTAPPRGPAAAAAAAAAATLAAAQAVEDAEEAGGSSATLAPAAGPTLSGAPAIAPTPGHGSKRSLGVDTDDEMTTSGKKRRVRKNWSAEEEERFMAVILGEGRGLSDAELVKLLAVEFEGERTALQVSGHLKNLRNAKRI